MTGRCAPHGDRESLRGMGEEILILVIQSASREQLANWLRVLHEVSAGDDELWSLLSKRNECCQFRRQGEKLLAIVIERASADQWFKWLQIPLEHARLAGKATLVQKMESAGISAPGAGGGAATRLVHHYSGSHQRQRQVRGMGGTSAKVTSPTAIAMASVSASAPASASAVPATTASPSPVPSPSRGKSATAMVPSPVSTTCATCCCEPDPSEVFAAAVAAASAAAPTPSRPISTCDAASAFSSFFCDSSVKTPKGAGAHMVDAALPCDATAAARADEQLALHRATMAGDVGRMRDLLAAGIDKNATDLWSCTALHRAAEQDRAEAVRLLLAAGMDAKARDMEGYTPLHFAAARGACTSLVDLLDAGACVSDRGLNGDTPLHSAVRFLSLSTVRVLLEWDADERALNLENDTPRDVTGVLPDGREIEHTPDPMAAQGILAALAAAPARRRFRIWKRRAWLVIFRSRRMAGKQAQQAYKARDTSAERRREDSGSRSENPALTYSRLFGVGEVMEQLEKSHRCSMEGAGACAGGAGACVGAGAGAGAGAGGREKDEGLLSLVTRTAELPEEGIFQKIVLFL